jgi:hypothetical protein
MELRGPLFQFYYEIERGNKNPQRGPEGAEAFSRGFNFIIKLKQGAS